MRWPQRILTIGTAPARTAGARCFYLSIIFTSAKGFAGQARARVGSRKETQTVSSSTTRYRDSRSLARLALVTRAVELGFIAAGITVCVVAAAESMATVLGWLSTQ